MGQLDLQLHIEFSSVAHEEGGNSWSFVFCEGAALAIEGIWRIFRSGDLVAVSTDHGHQFGHPARLDLVQFMAQILHNRQLLGINVNAIGDATFMFSGDVVLVAYVSSMGYESYQFTINERHYIGMGGGALSMY